MDIMTNEICFKKQILIFFHDLVLLTAIKTHDSHEILRTEKVIP